MPRPSPHDYPAQIWYESQSVFGGTRARNAIYNKHDAHVVEYKSSPIGAALRRYRPIHDHESHAQLFYKIVLKRIRDNTMRRGDCLLWIGERVVGAPGIYLGNRRSRHKINAYDVWHRQKGVYRGDAYGWIGTCENETCIEHRRPVSASEFWTELAARRGHNTLHLVGTTRAQRERSHINAELVTEMKRLKREHRIGYKKIAKKMNLKPGTVSAILQGKRWRGVGDEKATPMAMMASQLLGVIA